jgi:hypothetical protein
MSRFWVQPNGARLRRLAYRFAEKQKLLALGVYPSVSLAKARQEAKRLLAQGLDPNGPPNGSCPITRLYAQSG